MNYIDFKISLKTLTRFGGLISLLFVFINLISKYNNNSVITLISCVSFFIGIYFLLDLTSTMTSESLKYDKRTLDEIEQSSIVQKIHLLNAAQNELLFKYVSDDNIHISDLYTKMDNIEALKTGFEEQLYNLNSNHPLLLTEKSKSYV